ncbi:transcriptional repressor [Tissierella pigra]|uniref:Transcriptional repressor n=1 Tax=Tissierella pigra TaxID=2607614 RepID=A0A6N7XG55_9FIRM|nr:transcriptional repressor [Tissierella pigra]MBU5425951.1 transcriptional repressor [Tissierella pigra]MSU00686.1 transcriptional repressor [Tissierella pigra]
MKVRKSYNTKQKKLIISYLQENKDRHVTVEMIADYLNNKGESVGQTTIYRNLDKLVKDGIVLKFIEPEDMRSHYQYLEKSYDNSDYYHLICVGCGQGVRLNCNHINELTIHMQEKHGFNLDRDRTILYGYCEECRP